MMCDDSREWLEGAAKSWERIWLRAAEQTIAALDAKALPDPVDTTSKLNVEKVRAMIG